MTSDARDRILRDADERLRAQLAKLRALEVRDDGCAPGAAETMLVWSWLATGSALVLAIGWLVYRFLPLSTV